MVLNYGTNTTITEFTEDELRVIKAPSSIDSTADFTSTAIGNFGKWQLRVSFMMTLLKLPLAWFQLGIVFLAPPQDFWCKKPDSFYRYTDKQWREICSPKIEEHNCLIFDPDVLLSMPTINRKFIPLIECPEFVYDYSVFNKTITSEWNLVCSRHWLIQLAQCVMMWGVLIGGIIFGILADKYGRKLPLMTAIIMQSVTAFISSLVPWYWGFLVNRFFLALASGGIQIISFVMCMEVVSGKWRTIIPVLYHLPFGLGNAVMAGLAYYFRDWRKLELSMASLSSIYILYWFWLPESPRWLLAKGRIKSAVEVLKQAAIVNTGNSLITYDHNLLPTKPTRQSESPGFVAFMKFKNMRTKTILLSLNWFCMGLAFYAFSEYLGYIGSNIFLTVAFSGLISTPGSLICVYVVTKVGRKTSIGGFQIVTALCFIFILIIPKDAFVNDWPRFFFAGVGFAGMAGTVPALFLFSGELYPTLGRNAGVGGVSTFAKIGSMIAPALVTLDNIMHNLPLIILAAMSFLQVLLIVPLPETKDCPLPETIEDAERFDRVISCRYRNDKKY